VAVWIFKGIIILLAVITLAVFFAQNSSQSVDLRLLQWQWLQIPLYMVLVGSFLAGILVSLIVGGVRELGLRTRMHRLGRELKNRDREIAELRTMPLQDMDLIKEED
jgi:lipopolysaccharide assembly protein A